MDPRGRDFQKCSCGRPAGSAGNRGGIPGSGADAEEIEVAGAAGSGADAEETEVAGAAGSGADAEEIEAAGGCRERGHHAGI